MGGSAATWNPNSEEDKGKLSVWDRAGGRGWGGIGCGGAAVGRPPPPASPRPPPSSSPSLRPAPHTRPRALPQELTLHLSLRIPLDLPRSLRMCLFFLLVNTSRSPSLWVFGQAGPSQHKAVVLLRPAPNFTAPPRGTILPSYVAERPARAAYDYKRGVHLAASCYLHAASCSSKSLFSVARSKCCFPWHLC